MKENNLITEAEIALSQILEKDYYRVVICCHSDLQRRKICSTLKKNPLSKQTSIFTTKNWDIFAKNDSQIKLITMNNQNKLKGYRFNKVLVSAGINEELKNAAKQSELGDD